MMKPRRLTPGDAEAWRELRLDGLARAPTAFGSSHDHESTLPLSHFRGLLGETVILAVADADGRLLGTGGLRWLYGNRAHKALVWGMYVREFARSQGIGAALVAGLIAEARGKVEELCLTLRADNVTARAMYERLGFHVYATEPQALKLGDAYYDELLMRLRLPPAGPATC